MQRKASNVATWIVSLIASLFVVYGLIAGKVSPADAKFVGGGLLVCSSVYFSLVSEYKDECPNLVIFLLFLLGSIIIMMRGVEVQWHIISDAFIAHEDFWRRTAAFLLIMWVLTTCYFLDYIFLPEHRKRDDYIKSLKRGLK